VSPFRSISLFRSLSFAGCTRAQPHRPSFWPSVLPPSPSQYLSILSSLSYVGGVGCRGKGHGKPARKSPPSCFIPKEERGFDPFLVPLFFSFFLGFFWSLAYSTKITNPILQPPILNLIVKAIFYQLFVPKNIYKGTIY